MTKLKFACYLQAGDEIVDHSWWHLQNHPERHPTSKNIIMIHDNHENYGEEVVEGNESVRDVIGLEEAGEQDEVAAVEEDSRDDVFDTVIEDSIDRLRLYTCKG